MANSNNKNSTGLISKAFGVAKKLSVTGFHLVNHVAPGSVSKFQQPTNQDNIIEIKENENIMSDQKINENPQQIFRSHIPKVTQQLLGRHYSKVNNVTSFISPNLNNKIADFFFDKLNDFVSDSSSVDHVLKEVGAKSLDELVANPNRSNRIGQALANQNKTIAVVQGAVTGATGVIGTAIDIPLSLALTLRTIYQSGRAHGFELNRAKEQEIVEYVFKQVDLGSIAEKQTLLVGLRALSALLETQDTQQLQKMLGSSNDLDVLRKWVSNAEGTFKWSWLNHVPQISILSKLTPLAGAGIGAIYSWKLVDEASLKAQHIFSNAQQYILQHPNEKVDVLTAFEKAVALSQVQGLLNESKVEAVNSEAQVIEAEAIQTEVLASENDAITEIRVEAKQDLVVSEPETIEEGIQKLAEKYVEPVNIDSSEDQVIELEATPDDTTAKGEPGVGATANKKVPAKRKRNSKANVKADLGVDEKIVIKPNGDIGL